MYNNEKFISIAIIGCGASGVMSLINLIESYLKAKINKKIKIYIIEDSKKFGPGIAYSTNNAEHILNMRTGTMNLFPEKPQHFIKWLKANRKKLKLSSEDILYDSFLPRKIFGKYITYNLKRYLYKAKTIGIEVVIINEEAIQCKETKNKIKLKLTKTYLLTDYAILCLGNLPSTNYPKLYNIKSYFHSPWEVSKYIFEEEDSIGILGISLTAIDALLTLKELPTGSLSFISLNGRLPKVQGLRKPYTLKFITEENLSIMTNNFTKKLKLYKIVALFKKELEYGLQQTINWDTILEVDDNVEAVLENDIKNAKNGSTHWHTILDATSYIVPTIWDNLDDNDKRIFNNNFWPLWRIYRHCIPLQNAEKILKLFKSKRLRIVKNIVSVTYDKNNNVFKINYATNNEIKDLKFNYLIDATGTGFNITKTRSKLLQNMLKKGYITPHPFGGVSVNYETLQVIKKNNSESKNIFFFGQLTKGVHFYTNSIEMNSIHAKRVAEHVIKNVAAISL